MQTYNKVEQLIKLIRTEAVKLKEFEVNCVLPSIYDSKYNHTFEKIKGDVWYCTYDKPKEVQDDIKEFMESNKDKLFDSPVIHLFILKLQLLQDTPATFQTEHTHDSPNGGKAVLNALKEITEKEGFHSSYIEYIPESEDEHECIRIHYTIRITETKDRCNARLYFLNEKIKEYYKGLNNVG